MNLFDTKLVRLVWKLAWPTALYSLMQVLVGAVDLAMVGRLGGAGSQIGRTAVAAVGMSRLTIMLIQIVVLAVSTGATTMIAQFFGAGRRNDADNVASQAVKMMLLVCLLLGPIGFLVAKPLLILSGATETVADMGESYTQIFFGTLVFLGLNFCVAAILRGAGDVITPLLIALAVNLVNLVADWVLIFGIGPFPQMGVNGAAVGTALGRLVGTVIGLWILFRGSHSIRLHAARIWNFDFAIIWRMLKIGIPSAIQGVMRGSSRWLLMACVATFSLTTAAEASLSIGLQMLMFFVMIALAFQVAVVTLVGQSIGAGDKQKAERIVWEAMKTLGVILFVLGGLVAIFSGHVIRIFAPGDAEVIKIGTTMMYYIAAAQLLSGLAIAATAGLTGAGMTRPAMWYTLICGLGVMALSAFLLTRYTAMGLNGAWLALALAPAAQLALTARKFASGQWKHHEI